MLDILYISGYGNLKYGVIVYDGQIKPRLLILY